MTTRTTPTAHPSVQRACRWTAAALTLAAAFLLLDGDAYAQNSTMGFAVCQAVQVIYGNLGRAIATLAVMIIGIGASLGKVSWGLAITVAVGIAVIFQAGNIVGLLGVGVSGIAYGNCA